MVATNKKGSFYKHLKWILLFLSIFGAFGFEYAFDIPSAVKDLMHKYFEKKYSEEEFEIFYSLLYSIMALPNVLIPLFLGFLIDKVMLKETDDDLLRDRLHVFPITT